MAHVAGLLIRQRQLTVERGCNMETRAHHVVIGLFTLIVVSAALLFCLWLTNSGSDRQFRLYDIVFNEPVSGLSQGSTVQYSGIRVGEVTQLRPTETIRIRFGHVFAFLHLLRYAKIPKLVSPSRVLPAPQIFNSAVAARPARCWRAKMTRFLSLLLPFADEPVTG